MFRKLPLFAAFFFCLTAAAQTSLNDELGDLKKGAVVKVTSLLSVDRASETGGESHYINSVPCYTENGPEYRYSNGACATEPNCKFAIKSSQPAIVPEGAKLIVADVKTHSSRNSKNPNDLIISLEISFQPPAAEFSEFKIFCSASVAQVDSIDQAEAEEMIGWAGLELNASHQ